MPEIKHILFAQNASVMGQHRELIHDIQLAERLGAKIEFACSPEEVAPGSHFDVVIAPTLPWLPELLGRTARVQWIHFLSSGVEKIWQPRPSGGHR